MKAPSNEALQLTGVGSAVRPQLNAVFDGRDGGGARGNGTRWVMGRLVALGAAAAVSVAAIAVAESPRPPRGMRPYLLAISVASLDASVAWYEAALGLRTVERKAFPQQGIKLAFLESDGFRLELVELKDSVSPSGCTDVSNPAALRGFGKYAFQVDDLGGVVSAFKRHGTGILHDFSADPNPRERSVIVKDNDGNWLQFFQRPR